MISHNRPTLGKEEIHAAKRIITSGWLAQGEEVRRFENEFCQYLGLPIGHTVAVSSGTAALFLALWALNAENKIVSFPVYVCSAVRNAVAMARAKEHLVDVARNSPNIDLEIINKEKPHIVIIPHLYGIPVDIKCSKGIKIIEDCCHSLGAVVDGKSTGLKGDLGIFSFFSTKLITTGGQGGMVASKNKHFIEAIRDYREFDCRDDYKKRFNFQMTDLQAAIGREQLRKLPKFLKRREKIFKMYKDADLELLDVNEKGKYKFTPVRYRSILKSDHPKALIKQLFKNNIKAIIPIEDWELLGDSSLFPNALKLARETVSIPCYPSLTNREVEKIVEKIIIA